MRYLRETILSAVDASIDQASAGVNMTYAVAASLQAIVTGASSGTLKIQVSNDMSTAANWSDLPLATIAIAGAGSYLIPKNDMSYMALRAVYTHTNGQAGTLTVNLKTDNF